MADVRPIKKGTSTQFAEMGGTDTIPASLIGIVPKFEVPSGLVNGSNTVFTLSATPVANASVIMVLDGVTQTNGTDYTVSGTTVTFTTAPASGTELVAIYNSAASAGGGDFSSNTSSAVDGEVVLFSGTGGKTGKRATGTGIAKVTSGVLSALSAAQATTELNDFVGDSGSGGTKGLVPAPSAGDSTKYLKGDGTWGTVAGGGGSPSIITPSQITSDQTDYAPTGWDTATHVRLDGDNSIRAINSFSSSSISGGHEKTLINIGSYPIYFPGEHPNGTASNRIQSAKDYILYPSESIKIIYDSTLSRWLIFGYSAHSAEKKGIIYSFAAGTATTGDWGDFAFGFQNGGGVGTQAATASEVVALAAMNLSTSTTTTGAGYLYFVKTSIRFAYLTGGHVFASFFCRIPTLSDGSNTYTIYFTIDSTPNNATLNNNSVGIRYTHGTNSGKWEGFSRDNSGSESTVDLGITVTVDTGYLLRVEINKSKNEVRFYVNDVMSGIVTGNMPNTVAVGVRALMLKSAGTTSRSLYVHTMSGGAITT